MDLEDEFRFHLDLRIAELVSTGASPDDARREALRRFGDLDGARDYCRSLDRGRVRSERRRDWRNGWRQDLGFALRQLLRNPGFTFIAALTLALGVGANTAIFSVVHRLLLDPLPYAASDRLVSVMESGAREQVQMSPRVEVVEAWQRRTRTFEAIESFGEATVVLADRAETLSLSAGRIAPGVASFLGVTPALGRGFLADDAREGAADVVMLSHGFWQSRFGGTLDVVGRTVRLNGAIHTVIGVMPRDFSLPFMRGGAERKLWLPLRRQADDNRVQVVGRLRVGVTPAQATAELTGIMASLAQKETERSVQFVARVLRPEDMLSGSVRDTLLLLFAVVGVVLLIACANVANLLLARASVRHRELSIRAALGAGRGRLIRQLLTESICLALLGGAVGVLLATRGLDLIIAFRPDSLSELDDVRLLPIALAWSIGLSLVTGLVFGLAPAFYATDGTLGLALRSTSAGAGGHRGSRRLRAALVMSEVALSVTLLVGAGLLIRTVVRLQRADLGFDPRDVATIQLALQPGGTMNRLQQDAVERTLIARVRALPGVVGAVMASGVPPRGGAAFGELEIDGRALSAGEKTTIVRYASVAPDYFQLLRQRVTAGRTFGTDTSGNPMIINELMARRYWPGTSAIGKRYRLSPDGPWQTVIGVVADVRIPGRQGGGFDDLQTYAAYAPDYGLGSVVVRMRGDQAAVLRAVRREVEGSSPNIMVQSVDMVSAMIAGEIAGPRFSMTLFAVFALLALVLAAIGLYGVISFAVGQRTREIGVRIALGASSPSVVAMVVGQALRLTLSGIVVGLLVAAGSTRVMASMLFGMDALDPLTFAGVTALLISVALLASLFPARRAARVDPAVAFRSD